MPPVDASADSADDLTAVLRAGRPRGDARSLVVDGVTCPLIIAGRGRPVLCVHGLGHDAWDWTSFFAACAIVQRNESPVRAAALDLPGFGLADKPAGRRWDLPFLVDVVLAAAATLGEPPVLVGSSLGGHVALLAALRSPSAFAKLVLVAPGGVVDVPAPMQALARAYYSVDAICARREDEIAANSRRIFARAGSPFDDALVARKLAVHRSPQRRAFAVPFAGVVDDVFRHVVIQRLHEVRVPALVISGARDVVVPPDACAAAARALGARFVSLADVGHCPHLEAPAAFADEVLAFALSPAGGAA